MLRPDSWNSTEGAQVWGSGLSGDKTKNRMNTHLDTSSHLYLFPLVTGGDLCNLNF